MIQSPSPPFLLVTMQKETLMKNSNFQYKTKHPGFSGILCHVNALRVKSETYLQEPEGLDLVLGNKRSLGSALEDGKKF